MARNSSCPHIDNIVEISPPELCNLKKGLPCKNCDANSPNLWICLQKNCLQIGCSDKYNDHSTEHFEYNRSHCIQMNLSSQRVWCYLCECEVFLTNNLNSYNQYHLKYHHQRNNSIDSSDSLGNQRMYHHHEFYDKGASEQYTGHSSEYDEEEFDGPHELNGLVGLQNIANTCYMNSAIQALSNSPPLTRYFLDCGNIVEATCNLPNNINRTKPGLAKSYHRLIKDMWCNKRRHNGYIVPNGILQGIRVVHPMFRGFQQHDTQEFLRCFMDQLHEELKEVTPPPPSFDLPMSHTSQSEDENCEDFSPCPSPSPSLQSEADEYETCDSGVSERSSYSDDVSMASNSNIINKASRSPSPSQRLNNLSHSLNRTNSANSLSSQTNQKIKDSGSPQPTSQQPQQSQSQSQQQKHHRSIISEIFDGKLLSSVQCLTCDRISTREETFQDLSLPIPGKDHLAVLHLSQGIQATGVTCTDAVYQATHDGWIWYIWNWFRSWFWGPAVTLHDCMAAFFSADELKGDNMYSCEKCNKLRNGVKFSRVLALPEMLCVHLKRFRHDLSYSSKISSPVHFPLTGLDMRPYLHKDCKSKVSTYDLSAVICHHGTVGSGHYICYAKHHPTDKWFEYDDQLVTQVSAETVQNCEAYVLFYRKNNAQMSIIRGQAMELANNNTYQSSDIKFFVSKQWLNRFNTFAEPGPIDNWSILCQHGNLLPSKAAINPSLVVPLPQTLWDFLYERFGGGPVCNHPFECDSCKMAAEKLIRRQKDELEAFTAYRDEFQYQDNTSTLLAISMAWFRKWQAFARGETTEEPGPVNNTTIALHNDPNLPVRNVKQGSDYAQINWKLWKFFHNIYGGGPEIILRGGVELIKVEKEPDSPDETDNESVDQETGSANLSSLEQTKLMKENENETKYQQQQQQKQMEVVNPSILKPTKSVSFEEPILSDKTDGEDEDDTNNNHMENKALKNEKNVENSSKKSKYPPPTPAIAQLEIGNKKDKRNRSISIRPMFGADGKYSDYKYTNIPDEVTATNYSNHVNNNTITTKPSSKYARQNYDDAKSESDEDDTVDSGYQKRVQEPEENHQDFEKVLVNNVHSPPPQATTTNAPTTNNHHNSRRKKVKSKYAKKQHSVVIQSPDDSNKMIDP